MKKLLILIFLYPLLSFSQSVDTIIVTTIYKSYFSNVLHEPLYVSYKIYKSGGDCSRSGMTFNNDIKELTTATNKDYVKTGYDEGHLANAADFSKNCEEEKITFKFYNCLPQTPNLNRGVWKEWETTIRKESQNDSILIICGGNFTKINYLGSTNEIKNIDKIAIPDYCWKVTMSLSSKKVTHVLYFTNTTVANCMEIDLITLEKLLKYKIPLVY